MSTFFNMSWKNSTQELLNENKRMSLMIAGKDVRVNYGNLYINDNIWSSTTQSMQDFLKAREALC